MSKSQKKFSGNWAFLTACCFAGFEVGTFAGFQPDYLLTMFMVVAGLGAVGWSLFLTERFGNPIYNYLAVILVFTLIGSVTGAVTKFFQIVSMYAFAIDTAVILIWVFLVLGIDRIASQLYLKRKSQKLVVLVISIGSLLAGILSGFLNHEFNVVEMAEMILSFLAGLRIAWILVCRWERAVERSADDVSDSFVIRSFLLPNKFLF